MKVDDENMAGGMDHVPVGLDGSCPSGAGWILSQWGWRIVVVGLLERN